MPRRRRLRRGHGTARCALLPALDPAAELPAPAQTPRARWIDEGVQRVQWHTPPASVPEAPRRLRAGGGGGGAGQRPPARKVRIAAAVVLSLVLGAIILGAWATRFDRLGRRVVFIVSSARSSSTACSGARWRTGDEVERRPHGRARLPVGRSRPSRARYAPRAAWQLEDRDAFRRRFDSPVPGTPLKVLRGEGCRLVLWADYCDLTARRYHLIGVGARTVAHEVDDAGRSVANLDRLAAEVC